MGAMKVKELWKLSMLKVKRARKEKLIE